MFETASSETYGCNLFHCFKGQRRERDKRIKGIKIMEYVGEDTKEILLVEIQWTSLLVVD
jgi:hypothetical protein